MASFYTKGIVAPDKLPLQPHHLAVMDVIREYPQETPPGLEAVEGREHRVSSPEFDDKVLSGLAADVDEAKFTAGLKYYYDGGGGLNGDLSLSREKDGDGWYLFSDDGGAGDADLIFLEWLILDLDEEAVPFLTFEFANVCDRMLPDSHGGGAWFITRRGTTIMNSGSWLQEQERLFKHPDGLALLQVAPGDWKAKVEAELELWRKDPTYTPIIPEYTHLAQLHTPPLPTGDRGLQETKALLARVMAFMEDDGSITDSERKHLFEDVQEELLAFERALEPKEPHYMCPRCGSTEEISEMAWVDSNTYDMLEADESPPDEHFYCARCEAHKAAIPYDEQGAADLLTAWRKELRTSVDGFADEYGGEE